MAEECAICKREIGDSEEGPYRLDLDGKFGYMCGECKDDQDVVEGREKAWQRYQEHGDYISKYGRPYNDVTRRKEADDKARKTRENSVRE